MMIDEFVDPLVLTGYVRELPPDVRLLLNQFLPDENIGDIEAAIDTVQKTNRAAEFRAWDAETPIGPRDQFSRTKVKMPPLGIKRPIGEQERLMLERARTGGDNRSGYIQAIYDDAALGTAEVYRRMELARGDVLDDGKLVLTENGLQGITADFALPMDNQVSAATVWTDHADAAPLSELRAWVQLYVDINGEPPGYILTSKKVWTNLLLSDEVKGLFVRSDAMVAGGPNLINDLQLGQALAAFDIPAFTRYDTRIEKLAGGTARVLPEHKLFMGPANRRDLGFTAWGVTAEALELSQGQNPGLLFEELPGLVGFTLKDGDPIRIWTGVSAVGMPMIQRPEKLLVASVLTPS